MRVTAVLAMLAATAAAQGWHDLTGRKIPEIHAPDWINVPDGTPSNESLKGRIWLLEFFGTH